MNAPVTASPHTTTDTSNPIWIGLGVVALLVYFFVLGPDIPRV